MQKVAVVIGATGLVGSELVKQLINSEQIAKVVTLSRRSLTFQSEKVTNHVIDFEHLDQYKALIKGDLFFSCLGTTRKQAGSVVAQRRVDLDYQLQAARIAVENHIPHYLLVSSAGANSQSHSAYLKMKSELEQAIRQLSFERVSIFQPSLLLGHRAQQRFAEGIGARILPLICRLPGLQRFRPIQADQVASKMRAIGLSEGKGVCYYRLDDLFY